MKDFVISTEDIKLTKNLLTRTVEITKFNVDHLDRRLNYAEGINLGNNSHGIHQYGETDYDRASSMAISQDEFCY